MKIDGQTFRKDSFYFMPSGKRMLDIVGLSQHRVKSKRLKKEFHNKERQGNPSKEEMESLFYMSVFVNTAYELGRIDGESSVMDGENLDVFIDKLMDKVIEEKDKKEDK